MRDELGPKIRIRVVATNRGLRLDSFFVQIPHAEMGYVSGKSDLRPLAIVCGLYKLEYARHPTLGRVMIAESDHGVDRDTVRAAWNLLKNASQPARIRAGHLLRSIRGIKPLEEGKQRLISFDPQLMPPGNISFDFVDPLGTRWEVEDSPRLRTIIDGLVGNGTTTVNYVALASSRRDTMLPPFTFGAHVTKTTIVHHFPEGLPPERIHCTIERAPFRVPDQIEGLIDRAHAVLRSDAPELYKMPDHSMLAPQRIEVSMEDLDVSVVRIALRLAPSSYRYYAALASAQSLAVYDPTFVPLWQFAQDVPNPHQPAPASCSIGVRVIVETADGRFITSYRGQRVKVNRDTWSASANEGVRMNLLEMGIAEHEILSGAAFHAAHNELGIARGDCSHLVLVTLHRNAFNQWGATFWLRAELQADQVIRQQFAAHHAFEHPKVSSLPTEINECGRAMKRLGTRWYGGALESFSSVISFRELGRGRFIAPTEVGALLSAAAEDEIIPIDEINPVLLPAK